MSSPVGRPNSGDGFAKKIGELATPVTDVVSAIVPAKDHDAPVIPFTVVDAPSQRAYALAVYVALFAWRLYDYSTLIKDDADSLFFFMKWAMIDGLFIYGLPALRIPWLEWSGTSSLVLFAGHALLDWLLMFRVPLPIEAWLVGLTKVLYDRELSVSERKVKPADILRSSALILGKQTIHILPEGSAILNPEHQSYCLDAFQTSVTIPIRINQTNPILIELNRIDLDNNGMENITISAKQAKALKKQADRSLSRSDVGSPRDLRFQVRQPGLYRLQKVVDVSGLEVQRRLSDTLVVKCPTASLKPAPGNKCKGELSNMIIEVQGTPPLKIKYSRTVNSEDRGFSFQSIQPENLVSPLKGERTSGALVTQQHIDVSWARSHRIQVPLNESLNTLGSWLYSLEEVHDACGNVANYSLRTEAGDRTVGANSHLDHVFTIHPRPKASLETSESPCILKVARGHTARLPVAMEAAGRGLSNIPATISYRFTPLESLKPSGEHAMDAAVEVAQMKNPGHQPAISQPGLYSLEGVASRYCIGEILEPTSCLLTNPPQPALSLSSENIYDRCAGNSIGLRVDLDLIGTPPFEVHYEEYHKNRRQLQSRSVVVNGLRHQIEFRPPEAGHYVYRFKSIKDKVYDSRVFSTNDLVLEQDVKPLASAYFAQSGFRRFACIDGQKSIDVVLQGERPWTLDYEVVHGGKRSKHKLPDITEDSYALTTGPLTEGGEYTVALVSVQDRSGCRVFLSQETKIDVTQQRPRASFGHLEGKHTVKTLEGRKVALPVRLSGKSPWTVHYRNKNDSSRDAVTLKKLTLKNDMLEVSREGTYELLEVRDALCPGVVDDSASIFEVRWIPRPSIRVTGSSVVVPVGDSYIKKEVCEGDEDAMELTLTGTPPYYVKYQQRVAPDRGSASVSNKEFTAGLGVASIRMETAQAGQYEYRFSELGDYLYDYDPRRKQQPLVIRQRVNPKPSAGFIAPGKIYRYCKDEVEGDEIIPLSLQGTPPFYLELVIKHHSKRQPEVVRIPNIDTKRYDFRIPHRMLALGSHSVSVRKIRDSHGCQRRTELDAPHVQVNVADAPSISPVESKLDYCVGDRISYTLSGVAPFTVFYIFQGTERQASSTTTTFRRIAEKPGEFTVTGISDRASECKAKVQITKKIHDMPSVRISKGKETEIDIHEGGTAEILFEFSGTAPFEFTYTRSEVVAKGKKARVLETKSDVSYEHTKTIIASEAGTYEAVAIKDKFCAFSKQRPDMRQGQKLLQL